MGGRPGFQNASPGRDNTSRGLKATIGMSVLLLAVLVARAITVGGGLLEVLIVVGLFAAICGGAVLAHFLRER